MRIGATELDDATVRLLTTHAARQGRVVDLAAIKMVEEAQSRGLDELPLTRDLQALLLAVLDDPPEPLCPLRATLFASWGDDG